MNIAEMETGTILIVKSDDLRNFAESLLSGKSNIPRKQEPEIEQPISQPEAIEFLGKSRQTLCAWRRKGVIKSHTLGGRVYFLKSELLEALTKNK